LFEASFIFVVLLVLLVENVVEYVASKSGNASVPIWFVVTLGVVILSGIVTVSSVEASNKFCASSIVIAKSTPST
jgi:hypothetical protein